MRHFTAYLKAISQIQLHRRPSNPAHKKHLHVTIAPAITPKAGYRETPLQLPNRRRNHPAFFPLVLSHRTSDYHSASEATDRCTPLRERESVTRYKCPGYNWPAPESPGSTSLCLADFSNCRASFRCPDPAESFDRARLDATTQK